VYSKYLKFLVDGLPDFDFLLVFNFLQICLIKLNIMYVSYNNFQIILRKYLTTFIYIENSKIIRKSMTYLSVEVAHEME
jgi:hypothetical protein